MLIVLKYRGILEIIIEVGTFSDQLNLSYAIFKFMLIDLLYILYQKRGLLAPSYCWIHTRYLPRSISIKE